MFKSLCVWKCVCVCVNHLKRCKTSNLAGACGHHANACQRSYAWWWKPGLITLVYLLYHFNVFSNGTWLTQEPPCRFQTNCFLFSLARFSQSEFLPTLSDGTVASSKGVEKNPLHSTLSLTPSPSLFPVRFNWSVFCTSDAFHIRNWIRYFWASVWLMPDPSRWYEPFGESLSRLTVDSKPMSEFTLLN